MLAVIGELKAELAARLDDTDLNVRHMKRALNELDYEGLADLGLDVGYSWLDDVVHALVRGAPFVEVATISPYGIYGIDSEDGFEPDIDRLPVDERTGMLLGRLMRRAADRCENFRTVVLLADYTTDVYDGRITEGQKSRHIMAMARLLDEAHVIIPEDIPGEQFQLVPESTLLSDVATLIERLEKCENGSVERVPDGDVIFHPTVPFVEQLSLDSDRRNRELRRRGILLARQGRPTSHALEASSFLNDINSEILHLVILDKRFAGQQDKTYALIRAIDAVRQEHHHNVFFDSDRLSPELITFAMASLLGTELERIITLIDRIDEWSRFDPDEYAERNYARLMPEDRSLIQFAVQRLASAGLKEGSIELAADVGTGPNLYPPMLLSPYVADTGAIDLIEYSDANRAYLHGTIAEQVRSGSNVGSWTKFEDVMIASGGHLYEGAFERTCERANVVAGSIFDLPSNRYGLITSYFCTESITASRREFWRAIRSLAGCLKRDGLLLIAHMVGSSGYYAGVGTNFPSCRVDVDDIACAYRDAGLVFEIFSVSEEGGMRPRDGYHGMAVVIARRR